MADTISDKQKARVEKLRDGAKNLQKRRHKEWQENYELYRNKPQKNRITQRQSVTIPLMKETIQTTLSETDETPDIYFENLSNDAQKEIFMNEYWGYCKDKDSFVIKDTVDKKLNYLYGRSTMKLNIIDGMITTEVLEPHDVLIDDNADPADIDGTAMYIAHRNIYVSLDEILANDSYEDAGKEKLVEFFNKEAGKQASDANREQFVDKNERLSRLGYSVDPETGQRLANLTEHYVKEWDDEAREFVIKYYVTAEDQFDLLYKDLRDVLNINFFPFVSWASDTEKTDIYSDSIGDIIRTPNKIVNAWFSQLVENRTLKNLGMQMYNSEDTENFSPNSFSPRPWGWYPVPGNPNELVKQMDIPDLSGSLDEMQFVINSAERASGATSIMKGQSESGAQTLGEVMELAQKSVKRISSLAKYYREARRKLGEKWYKLASNNEDKLDAVEVFKKSHKDNYFSQKISSNDWKDEAGYKCKVTSKAESERETVAQIKKLGIASQYFQGNAPLGRILKRRVLEFLDLSSEELEEVMAFEEVKQEVTGMGLDPAMFAQEAGEEGDMPAEETPEQGQANQPGGSTVINR